MHQNCEECSRLGNEFALAARHCLNVEAKLRMAGVSRDDKSLRELRPALERATAERERIRRRIETHQAEAADNTGAAVAEAG
jgi:hypothetical protein